MSMNFKNFLDKKKKVPARHRVALAPRCVSNNQRTRAIGSGRLTPRPKPRRLHRHSINPVFYGRPRPRRQAPSPGPMPGNGRLVSGRASRLDAFSGYPLRRSCPALPCRTTGRPEAAARRSSRTGRTFPSGGQHPRQVESDLSRDGLNPSHVPL